MTDTTVWRIERADDHAGPFQDPQVCHYGIDCGCEGLHLDMYRAGEWRAVGVYDRLPAGRQSQFIAGCRTPEDLAAWFTADTLSSLDSFGYVLAQYQAVEVVDDPDARQVAFTGTRVRVLPVRALAEPLDRTHAPAPSRPLDTPAPERRRRPVARPLVGPTLRPWQ